MAIATKEQRLGQATDLTPPTPCMERPVPVAHLLSGILSLLGLRRVLSRNATGQADVLCIQHPRNNQRYLSLKASEHG